MGIIKTDMSAYLGDDGGERYLADLADTKQSFINGDIGEEEAEPMRRNLSIDTWRRLVAKRFCHQQAPLLAAASAESHTGKLLAAFISELL